VSLYYPPLKEDDTIAIVKMNLERLKMIDDEQTKVTEKEKLRIFEDEIVEFARKHYREHSVRDGEGRWNGRQIRNAVQIAACLSYYDKETKKDSKDLPPLLMASHFKSVADTTAEFDEYMSKTRGGTDGYMSHHRSERFDSFKSSPKADMAVDSELSPSPAVKRERRVAYQRYVETVDQQDQFDPRQGHHDKNLTSQRPKGRQGNEMHPSPQPHVGNQARSQANPASGRYRKRVEPEYDEAWDQESSHQDPFIESDGEVYHDEDHAFALGNNRFQ
jgi:hypothetical protein